MVAVYAPISLRDRAPTLVDPVPGPLHLHWWRPRDAAGRFVPSGMRLAAPPKTATPKNNAILQRVAREAEATVVRESVEHDELEAVAGRRAPGARLYMSSGADPFGKWVELSNATQLSITMNPVLSVGTGATTTPAWRNWSAGTSSGSVSFHLNDAAWEAWSNVAANASAAITGYAEAVSTAWTAWVTGVNVSLGAMEQAVGSVNFRVDMERNETEEAHAARLEREAAARAERERQEAERRARESCAEKERRAAVERAEELLLTVISPKQRRQYQERKEFELTVHRPDGSSTTYVIRRGRSGNVTQITSEGKFHSSLCCHPESAVPDQDTMLAQYLFLLHSEEEFIRTANRGVISAEGCRDDAHRAERGRMRARAAAAEAQVPVNSAKPVGVVSATQSYVDRIVEQLTDEEPRAA